MAAVPTAPGMRHRLPEETGADSPRAHARDHVRARCATSSRSSRVAGAIIVDVLGAVGMFSREAKRYSPRLGRRREPLPHTLRVASGRRPWPRYRIIVTKLLAGQTKRHASPFPLEASVILHAVGPRRAAPTRRLDHEDPDAAHDAALARRPDRVGE